MTRADDLRETERLVINYRREVRSRLKRNMAKLPKDQRNDAPKPKDLDDAAPIQVERS